MKKISKNILFFIPSYNDTKNAFVIARSIKKIFPKSEVLVIDDGSNEVFFPKKGDRFKFFSLRITLPESNRILNATTPLKIKRAEAMELIPPRNGHS